MYSAEPLPHFIDDYLRYLHETHPTAAAFDGVHAYDDLLEDLTRPAIDDQIRKLGDFARRLDAIDPTTLVGEEAVERPMAASHIQAHLFELETIKTWERNPQCYAELIASSLASQVLFDYAPLEERARRVISKERQIPGLLHAARQNIKDPPGIFVKVGLETLRGTLTFVERDLPRAFSAIDDVGLLSDLADVTSEAAEALRSYIAHLESDVLPKARGSFRLGRERFERKLLLDEGITKNADQLLLIATRELREIQEEFRRVASRLNGADAPSLWRATKERHPEAGQLASTAQQQLDDLSAFVDTNRIVTRPPGQGVVVAPTPDFYRWTAASMWTPGPFEPRPLVAYYYITDVDPTWSSERQKEHLRDFNLPALWSISIHEVFPGHFLHYQHLRQVTSKLRKSIIFAPTSFVEGWAHYCEQMMLDAGFGQDDPTLKLGQLAEALIRAVRFVVGIRLHAEDLSVEQGMRFFRDEAFMEEVSARREAERGTFDPSYIVYTAGKLMMLKLRADYKQQQGSRFSLKTFHDKLLGNGNAPFALQRQLMLGEQGNAVVLD